MSQDHQPSSELSNRCRRILFRATHRGTKETDLMVGGFVRTHIASFEEKELDELEAVLELLDVDLADWLIGRREIPAIHQTPMLMRMAEHCSKSGAGLPEALRQG
ncbi:succinate dehydrogenase assembly factor 2 [Pseudoroseomonas globiformis]|uniref:FAD assembly factor SdhE n=1 Tax=Teichococcus globiformis TaxID=2307229 RepID=A0ABV7G2B6_9PROT